MAKLYYTNSKDRPKKKQKISRTLMSRLLALSLIGNLILGALKWLTP